MSKTDLSWAVPVMRAGYAGRGLVYVVVAGFSLWAIWRGGQAEGTGTALQSLETTTGGGVVLVLIVLGLLAYMVWRLVDAFWDLEAYGTDGEGMVARTGMVVTGLIHGAIGVGAAAILFGSGSGGGGSSATTRWLEELMSQPGGRWAVGIAGLVTIGAGLYYLHKAWKETYRKELRASRFTTRWNGLLKAGVAAQGVVVLIVGGLILSAALSSNASEAGGLGSAFGWLYEQAYGRILVTLLCVGLLMFALFCFVNAAYRIVPKVAGDDIETLGHSLKAKARAAAS
ncbi:hypothetical protein OG2516_03318 [Oceanicola granulosus HTCC2516]|uniref:DUF1206 domain-containing protein n=1 Tax=Oceanicola granulosus (strain ATCC BAA-861 / DSM 15982 / KCTC 12143 / HTCC2516) TaxID=314256 RepID=Q2CE62_OCEGH|nr:DUF1206 domain-containing protein [Oceanicola granulosus]EAR50998.1 hypothetical protein OG2516_03318 [Oceanicola granulosus HTCC2516]